MKTILKSSAVLISLFGALYTPMASAKGPPADSPAYEATVGAASVNTGSGAYHSPIFASAVPEADTYAMMLSGLGLVGFMVYRRRR